VSWSLTGEASARRLAFRWRETGGPVVSPPEHKGFGSALIEAAVPSASQRAARLAFPPEGLTYELDLPSSAIASEPLSAAPVGGGVA